MIGSSKRDAFGRLLTYTRNRTGIFTYMNVLLFIRSCKIFVSYAINICFENRLYIKRSRILEKQGRTDICFKCSR